eukprot:1148363-Ditylum_brightwellii.AAC.1
MHNSVACGQFKISHSDKNVVTEIISKLQESYRKETPLTINRGKVHNYLGMTLDFLSPKKVSILMLEYIEKLLLDLPDDFEGEAATPAANHLFEVDKKAEKLDKKD